MTTAPTMTTTGHQLWVQQHAGWTLSQGNSHSQNHPTAAQGHPADERPSESETRTTLFPPSSQPPLIDSHRHIQAFEEARLGGPACTTSVPRYGALGSTHGLPSHSALGIVSPLELWPTLAPPRVPDLTACVLNRSTADARVGQFSWPCSSPDPTQ